MTLEVERLCYNSHIGKYIKYIWVIYIHMYGYLETVLLALFRDWPVSEHSANNVKINQASSVWRTVGIVSFHVPCVLWFAQSSHTVPRVALYLVLIHPIKVHHPYNVLCAYIFIWQFSKNSMLCFRDVRYFLNSILKIKFNHWWIGRNIFVT